MSFKLDNKFKINSSCISTSIEEKSVILNIENGKYYELNHTASVIWNCIKKDSSLKEIELELINNFDVDKNSVKESTEIFLNKCLEYDFIKKYHSE